MRRNIVKVPASTSTMPALANTTVTSHFPMTIAFRDTGFIRRGSSEPRSRSPAVVSIATFIPDTNAAVMMKSGMKLRKLAKRC